MKKMSIRFKLYAMGIVTALLVLISFILISQMTYKNMYNIKVEETSVMTENVESFMMKKYQEAFDYYIEHLANSTEVIYSTYNKEKSEGAFVLNQYGIEMFAALHSEDLIEIDLSKIKSEKIRGIIEREIMPKVKTDYIINVSDEEEQELEKILEMFNI